MIIGNLVIGMSTNTTKATRGVAGMRASLASLESAAARAQTVVAGLAAAAAVGGIAAGLFKAAKAAAELQESIGGVQAVFGDAAGTIRSQADKMALAYGYAVGDMLDNSTRLGSIFKGAGFSDSSAAEYTNMFARVAADYRALLGGNYEETFQKFISGLSGETEPLKALGIQFNENAIAAKAMEMGLVGANGQLSEGAKMQARAAIILEKAKDAMGQAGREANGSAAQIEALSGRWENLVTTVGGMLAPAVGSALGEVGVAIEALRIGWENNSAAIVAWATGGVGNLEAFTGGVGIVQKAVMGIADAWQVVQLVLKTGQGIVLGMFEAITEGLALVFRNLDKALDYVGVGGSGLGETFTTAADSMRQSMDQFQKEWKAVTVAPWASEDVAAMFGKAKDQIQKAREELAAAPTTVGKAEIVANQQPKATKVDFAGALVAGSKEAASVALRSRYGGGKDAVADNTKATAAHAKEIAEGVKTLNAGIRAAMGGIPLPIFTG